MAKTTMPPQPPRPDKIPLPADQELKLMLSVIEPEIGHVFNRPLFLWQALQNAASPAPDLLTPEGNKRMAVVGGLALKLTIADYYHRTGADCQKIAAQADSVSANFLEEIRQKMGLGEVRDLSLGDASVSADLETTVRAVFGAVFCDGGIVCVRKVAVKLHLI